MLRCSTVETSASSMPVKTLTSAGETTAEDLLAKYDQEDQEQLARERAAEMEAAGEAPTAALTTAAGSGSPVIEAGGARPVPDPRWLARASTYDTACSAPDADPAEYVQCIAMHVDDSVAAPAHATDATCVLASLVTDDKLGLANCRFVAQHLGRTAFDAGVAASPAEAETAAREAFPSAAPV